MPTGAACMMDGAASAVRECRVSDGITIASIQSTAKATSTGKRENLEDALRDDIAVSSPAHYRHERRVGIIAARLPPVMAAAPASTAWDQQVVLVVEML